ncbi:MAG: Sec-independent protein secretion pathway component TatC [Flavobacteriales bacterium]|jgi:Sec-independent protein secretion pathway component TatC
MLWVPRFRTTSQNMKHLLKAIIAATLAIPIAAILYQIVAWLAYGFYKSELEFTSILMLGAGKGVFGALLGFFFICLYGLPVFLILRYFEKTNLYIAIFVSISPWLVIDGLMNKNMHHGIEFSWYSLGILWLALVCFGFSLKIL